MSQSSSTGSESTVVAPPPQPKTCGLAIAGLVCGIAGLCTLGLGGIPGLILGIKALSKIGRSGGQLAGRGTAIAAVIISAMSLLLLLMLPLLIAILIPAVFGALDLANSAACANNMSQLAKSAQAYAVGHRGAFPVDTWPDVFKSAFDLPEEVLADPAAPLQGRAYAMNALLRDVRMAEVRHVGGTVLFFECAPGTPPSGGPKDLPPKPRHASVVNIAFVDGHVAAFKSEQLGGLIWDPREERPSP